MASGDALPYRIELTKTALRQLGKLSRKNRERIAPEISALASDPRPDGHKKLKGADDLYRIRVGPYRVVYQIPDDVLVILVVRVGHRRDICRGI